MTDRDGKFFNCSEAHELNAVSSKYEDREKVKEFIKTKCKDRTIHYWTHDKLAEYLAENGFRLKTKIGQNELITRLADKFESRIQAQAAFNAVIACLSEALQNGDSLTIKGFGTFHVVERAARQGRNPRTGEVMSIAASKNVKFTPSSALKKGLAGKN